MRVMPNRPCQYAQSDMHMRRPNVTAESEIWKENISGRVGMLTKDK